MIANEYERAVNILKYNKIKYEKYESEAWDNLLGTCHGVDTLYIGNVELTFLDGKLDDISLSNE
jgi:hypothetical protein